MIAIENVRLFDEVQARTRELSESLEQQTATSEVLKIISSSRGELTPVFDAMLETPRTFVKLHSAICFYVRDQLSSALSLCTARKATSIFGGVIQ